MRTEHAEEKLHKLFVQCSALMQSIGELPQPVIAQVHAMATAAGCQLVSAQLHARTHRDYRVSVATVQFLTGAAPQVATSDMAIAADTASFATPGQSAAGQCRRAAAALRPVLTNAAVNRSA
jgi:hypothetical protein